MQPVASEACRPLEADHPESRGLRKAVVGAEWTTTPCHSLLQGSDLVEIAAMMALAVN